MKVSFYDIKAQYDELHQEIDEAVHGVISSGIYTISGGKCTPKFEQEMAELHNVRYAIAVNSGTDALRILMDSAGIGLGDEVITPSFTFVASVETILQTGATAVFADIDLETFCICPKSIESAITPKTKAIMPVHLFGQLANVQAISEIARKHNLIVLEDAAQAINNSHNGIAAGNFGLGAGISFYVTKNLGAAGDAGIILTNSEEMDQKCRSIRQHGMGRARYYYDQLGYTSRLDEVQAAFLSTKLKALPKWQQRKSTIANRYLEGLTNLGIKLPKISQGNNHTWHQFAILSTERDSLKSFLAEKEIDTMIYYPVPIHHHEPYKHCPISPTGLENSDLASAQVLCLPIHPHLKDEQVQFVLDTVREFQLSHAKSGTDLAGTFVSK